MAAPLLKTEALPERQPPLVALIRMAAMGCRAMARLDAGRACALLDERTGPEQVVLFLVRALPQVMRRRPVILAPGDEGRSFDEDWLLALSAAIARGDAQSERFLLRSRCTPAGTRALALLMRGLAERMPAA